MTTVKITVEGWVVAYTFFATQCIYSIYFFEESPLFIYTHAEIFVYFSVHLFAGSLVNNNRHRSNIFFSILIFNKTQHSPRYN